jgi:Protein of unknown function (DUF3618)
MDSSRSRTPPADRVAEIRADIVSARTRMAETLEALRFKADLPARLGDSVGNAAMIFTEHVFDRVTSAREDEAREDEATEQHLVPPRASNEPVPPRDDERSGSSGPTGMPA